MFIHRLKILLVLCCGLTLMPWVPIFAAQEDPTLNPKQLQIYFSSFSTLFGCPKNSYAKFTDINIGEMQFLPKNQNGTTWTQLFTATIQTLPNSTTLSLPAINGYAANLLNNYAKHAKIIREETFKAPDGTPVIYMEYKIRTGFFREHGVGVYGRHTQTMAAFTRYEVRGRELRDDERAVMQQIARTLTTPAG
ncbi:MAG: hypothetical protein PHD48_01330 [Alphaproteobacteria bacterium]|nr:hypothetical protein [Alphaproteobacteria bacterium]